MYIPLRVLCGVLFAAFLTPALGNVATTAGSNLTAYNGTGATNNNQWNNMMNSRANNTPTVAKADFGNCEAVILRCATPKCSSGCGDFSLARSIVAGCVNSNATCKKHGDALIDSLAAQVVAKSNVKAQEQQNAGAIAQAQAQAQAAAEQSNAQMQQMQSQMAAMQQQMAESMAAMQEQMAAQNESQAAQIQSALAESRSNAAVTASESTTTIEGLEGLGAAEQLAAKNGINPDILVREQIGGQIQTSIDDAVLAMKNLKAKMDALFEYAGCDSSANNCTGPRRVKKFKDLANEFFDPYENVVENMYDALVLAMTVGIDVSDVIMLLSGACNMWGKYMCGRCSRPGDHGAEGYCECYDKDEKNCYYRVVTDSAGKVSKNQPHCRLVGIINDGEEVQREWVDANSGMTGATQVACASDVVMDISLFRGMKKSATLDIETLRSLVNQDAYGACQLRKGQNLDDDNFIDACGAKFCLVNPDSSPTRMQKLQNAVKNKKLGRHKDYCFPTEESMKRDREDIAQEVIKGCEQYKSSGTCDSHEKDGCGWDYNKGACKTGVIDTCAKYSTSACGDHMGCKLEDGKCVSKNPLIQGLTPKSSSLVSGTLKQSTLGAISVSKSIAKDDAVWDKVKTNADCKRLSTDDWFDSRAQQIDYCDKNYK